MRGGGGGVVAKAAGGRSGVRQVRRVNRALAYRGWFKQQESQGEGWVGGEGVLS